MTWMDAVAQDAAIVLTLLALEAVLSFDNAAILAAMVRKLPIQDRRKALLYGLVGAYALRTAAILGAAFLIRTPELKVIGGLYLLLLGIKHFINVARHEEHHHKPHNLSGGFLLRMGLPPLVAVIIQIELIDLAFAIDQVVVAVAFTDKISLIIVASMVGILFLRLAAAVIARVMDWLPLLEHMAYVAVAYVGVKLILLYPVPFLNHGHGVHIPTALSIGITLGLFGIPILLKLLFGWPRSRPGDHIAVTHPVTAGETPAAIASLHEARSEVRSGTVEKPDNPPPMP